MVADVALQYALGGLDFGSNNVAGDGDGVVFRLPVLGAPQQNIATLSSLQPPEIAAVFGEKRQIDAVFAAKAHQKR